VTEELGLEKLIGQGSAIDGDEGPLASLRAVVNEPGDDLLAGAGLTVSSTVVSVCATRAACESTSFHRRERPMTRRWPVRASSSRSALHCAPAAPPFRGRSSRAGLRPGAGARVQERGGLPLACRSQCRRRCNGPCSGTEEQRTENVAAKGKRYAQERLHAIRPKIRARYRSAEARPRRPAPGTVRDEALPVGLGNHCRFPERGILHRSTSQSVYAERGPAFAHD